MVIWVLQYKQFLKSRLGDIKEDDTKAPIKTPEA
jgi:hypothetical protein